MSSGPQFGLVDLSALKLHSPHTEPLISPKNFGTVYC